MHLRAVKDDRACAYMQHLSQSCTQRGYQPFKVSPNICAHTSRVALLSESRLGVAGLQIYFEQNVCTTENEL